MPKFSIAQTRNYDEFVKIASSPPQFQWAYCGSDSKQHYFAQWLYGAMLFNAGRSSYLKEHMVPREEMNVKGEFPRTNDMDKWRVYNLMGGDRDGEFSKDFLRKGDHILSASLQESEAEQTMDTNRPFTPQSRSKSLNEAASSH
ncbi:MAG TPA: hypothetical protein VLS94_01070 [Fusibacter sp.]|nr:hypothetical protein [Fusibacter sp.]